MAKGMFAKRRPAKRMRSSKKKAGARLLRMYHPVPQERKYVDFTFGTTAAPISVYTAAGAVQHVSIIPTGSLCTQRNGRKATLKACELRGSIEAHPGNAVTWHDVSVYLIWDQSPVFALATISGIFDADSPNAFQLQTTQSRFQILKKWTCSLTAGNGTYTGNDTCRIDDYVKLPGGAICQWTNTDTSGVIGNCSEGALLMVAMAAGDVNNVCYVRVTGKLFFDDD